MKRFALISGLVLTGTAYATTYTLEPNYTQVVFNWDHLGFSFPNAQISQGAGMIEFDAMQPTMASVKVTLPLAMLNTGVPDLDERLKSDDFFDVAKYPQAVFTSTKVEKGAGADRLKVWGNVTLHNVTRAVTLDVQVLKVGVNPRTGIATVGFHAWGKLKRSDFGLDKFVPQVGDEIELTITTQGAEAKAYAARLQKQAEEAASAHK